MSNWCSVIVVWDGHERAANDGRLGGEILDRILGLCGGGDPWQIRWPCGSQVEHDTFCCEFVAVGSINHFIPHEAMQVLHEYAWESPQSVQILWKDENMDQYAAVSLEAAL